MKNRLVGSSLNSIATGVAPIQLFALIFLKERGNTCFL